MNNKNNVADPATTPKHEAAAKGQHAAAEPAHKVGHAAPGTTHKDEHKATEPGHQAEKAHMPGDAMKPGEKPKK